MANRRSKNRSGATVNKKEKGREEAVSESATKYMVVGIVMVVMAVALITFMMLGGDSQEPYNNANTNDDGNILIPLTDIGTTANFFQQSVDGVTIKYFTLKGSDGQIHTAFDACDVCYNAKQGYEQRGDDMVCKNCGNMYPTNGIGSENVGGGCWPGYLETNKIDGNLVITESSLAKGKYYFN